MPSDPRVRLALDALGPAIRSFEATLAMTAEDVRRYLAERQSTVTAHVTRITAELGPFGAQHLDPMRIAALFDHAPEPDAATDEIVEQALATLHELEALEEDLFVAAVEPGGSLAAAVERALARAGRAFGAARVVQAVRAGRYRLSEHARSLGAFPFARWNGAERRLAPPLVARVGGAELRPGALAAYLDGGQKLVLVVDGPCSPAPLVRLVTPGAFVLQTGDGAGLDRFAAFDGPGIAALVPEGAARFTHDPAGGAAPWQRLTVAATPSGRRQTVGGLSAAQQADELKLLAEFAAPPPAAESVARADVAAPDDPAAKLAAWLLRQADLTETG